MLCYTTKLGENRNPVKRYFLCFKEKHLHQYFVSRYIFMYFCPSLPPPTHPDSWFQHQHTQHVPDEASFCLNYGWCVSLQALNQPHGPFFKITTIKNRIRTHFTPICYQKSVSRSKALLLILMLEYEIIIQALCWQKAPLVVIRTVT